MAKTTASNLLIISDLVINVVWLKKHLKEYFNIIVEKNDKTALDRVKNSLIDFIIVDGHLKNVNALNFLIQLRKAIRPNWIPILLITDNLKKSYRDRALKAGATDFLNDPLDESELYSRIETSLKSIETEKKVTDISEELKKYKQVLPQNLLSTKFLLSDKAIRAIAKAKKEGIPLTTALIRLDSYDHLESRFGAHGMDKLLLIFSEMLLKSVEPTDILIPSKDGKFVLIMPNVNLIYAKKKADQLRKKISARVFKTNKGSLTLSISVVLTTSDEKGKLGSEAEFDRMLEVSNRAMKKLEKGSQIISLPKKE